MASGRAQSLDDLPADERPRGVRAWCPGRVGAPL